MNQAELKSLADNAAAAKRAYETALARDAVEAQRVAERGQQDLMLREQRRGALEVAVRRATERRNLAYTILRDATDALAQAKRVLAHARANDEDPSVVAELADQLISASVVLELADAADLAASSAEALATQALAEVVDATTGRLK